MSMSRKYTVRVSLSTIVSAVTFATPSACAPPVGVSENAARAFSSL
jgi:hypothetical protein